MSKYIATANLINADHKMAPNWQANGWKKKGGEIKNLDIVQQVYQSLYASSNATLTWVRGHEGDEGNEMADEWANRLVKKKYATLNSSKLHQRLSSRHWITQGSFSR